MKPVYRINDLREVHIVGVAGSATSGLARILDDRGVHVSGSDQGDRRLLERLRKRGIDVVAGHADSNLKQSVDVVVHSAAVPADNPEILAARSRGIPVRKYADFLGELLTTHHGIAIAGTHGKTSTAGVLTSIFLAAGRDPSVLIGGEHPELGGNWRRGRDHEFIAEACEFDRSFHSLHPAAGIITNMERDHPEVYPDESSLESAFQEFVLGFESDAVLVLNGDNERLRALECAPGMQRVTFGFEDGNDYQARVLVGGAHPTFEIYRHGEKFVTATLGVHGRHSVSNALGAAALAAELGLSAGDIRVGLQSFPGIARRLECKGDVCGRTLFDDYAHHPTEVSSTLDTLQEMFKERPVWAVFQPHQFTRLDAFLPGFAEALARADRVVLLPVYSVRERPSAFSGDPVGRLQTALEDRHTAVDRFYNLEDAADELADRLDPDAVCITLGAGDVFRVIQELERRLQENRVDGNRVQ